MSRNLPNKEFKDPLWSTLKRIALHRPLKKLKKRIPGQRIKFQLIRKIDKRVWKIFGFHNEKEERDAKKALGCAKKTHKITFHLNLPAGSKMTSHLKFTEAFKRLTLLQSISFDFTRRFQIADDGLDFLIKSTRRPKLLKEIALKFEECSQVTDVHLQKLAKCLQRSILLQKINLNFTGCKQLQNIGLYHLSEGLKRLASLQNITLNFHFCSNLTDEGLQDLALGLKGLVSLQSIDLCFDHCNNITDKGLNGLCETIEKLACIQEMCISFKWCPKISFRRERQTISKNFEKGPSAENNENS